MTEEQKRQAVIEWLEAKLDECWNKEELADDDRDATDKDIRFWRIQRKTAELWLDEFRGNPRTTEWDEKRTAKRLEKWKLAVETIAP